MDVNLELYKTFYCVAKSGSISKAAKALYVSQPAVTQAIQRLEDNLGTKVFIRTPRGIKLTREAEILFRQFELSYLNLINAENRFKELMNLVEGTIAIGASDTVCKYYLLPRLTQFHQAYPAVKILVTNGTTPETLNLLQTGQVDLGIVSLPVPPGTFAIQNLMEVQDCFVAGERYKDLAGQPMELADLQKYPIMLLEKGSSSRRYVDEFLARNGIVLKPEFELGSIDVLIQFALAGLGIACVVKDFAAQKLREGSLYEVALREPIPARKLGLATLTGVPLSASARRFVDLLI